MTNRIVKGLTCSKSAGREKSFATIVHKTYEYAFNENNSNWNPKDEYNLAFLRSNLSYFINLFDARGYLFLNEVLDSLGLERCAAGQIVGWYKNHGHFPQIRYAFEELHDAPGEHVLWITIEPGGVIAECLDPR